MSSVDMTGKLCLVTGANSGIGKETALGLARMGATIIMVCRSRERGEKARREIVRRSHNKDVHLMLADLSSQESIYALAEQFRAEYDQLDVLVNNAGALFYSYQESVDGIEMTFALNHLGYFLLTDLLLDVLIASAPARIVNVSSGAHYNGTIHFDNIQLEGVYGVMKAYSQSKLANVLFTYELARRLEGMGVTVNCLHPGFVSTNFGREGFFSRILMTLLSPFALDQKKGAETPIYLASAPEVADVTGQYFEDKQPQRSSRESYDEDVARRLWAVSEALVRQKV